MMKTTPQTVFDAIDNGYAKAVVNLCDCFGNISCQTNIEFRVRYPGLYAADQLTEKGDTTKLGTVSFSTFGDTIIFNAYVSLNFNKQLHNGEWSGTIFDPTAFISCLYQIQSFVPDYDFADLFISISSFAKFDLGLSNIVGLITDISKRLNYDIVVAV